MCPATGMYRTPQIAAVCIPGQFMFDPGLCTSCVVVGGPWFFISHDEVPLFLHAVAYGPYYGNIGTVERNRNEQYYFRNFWKRVLLQALTKLNGVERLRTPLYTRIYACANIIFSVQ